MQSLSEVGVIELSQPLAGGTPDYIATTFAPHLYDIKSITWYDALGEELPANIRCFESEAIYWSSEPLM